jgi:two-component sensor histidine kinase
MRPRRSLRRSVGFAAGEDLAGPHGGFQRRTSNGIRLRELVEDELAPYRQRTNASIEGPDLPLRPESAHALAIALHELVTNAVKHGALSTADGRVAVWWQVAGELGSARLNLVWQEADGPPVTAPQPQGLGSRLIRDILHHELGGRAELSLAPTGVRCEIEVPLAHVADTPVGSAHKEG